MINKNSTAMLAAGIFPKATSGHNFIGGIGLPTNVREELVRIDHRFNDKFWLFGHWLDEPTTQSFSPPMWGAGNNVPTTGNAFSNPSRTGVVHLTNAISPTLLFETAFNYDGNKIAITPTGVITAGVRRAAFPSCSRVTI